MASVVSVGGVRCVMSVVLDRSCQWLVHRVNCVSKLHCGTGGGSSKSSNPESGNPWQWRYHSASLASGEMVEGRSALHLTATWHRVMSPENAGHRTSPPHQQQMAGSKRQKLKKKAGDLIDAFSPSQSPVSANSQDDGLLDDLLAQLNQPNGQANPEAGKVLLETTSQNDKSTESLSSKLRKDPRTRWKERQVSWAN